MGFEPLVVIGNNGNIRELGVAIVERKNFVVAW